MTMIRRAASTPSMATRVIVAGKGEVDTTDVEETPATCNKLENRWDELMEDIEDDFNTRTFIALTADMYCPTELKKKVGSLYREVEVESGYADDGTPVDVLRNPTIAEATKDIKREKRSRRSLRKKADKKKSALRKAIEGFMDDDQDL